jgi:gamma-glutamyltranspeptidase
MNLLLDFIEFQMLPEAAVTAPRFATAHHQDSFDPNPNRTQVFKQAGSLTISGDTDLSVQQELSIRGHQLEVKSSPIASPVMLYIDQGSGTLYAAGDPEAGRHVAGLGKK